ncbi:SDR family NAD(P)-dependent oxidoreductase [Phenylobacterium sp.]|jgi:NAD(P)-dependent dehydrogenase (short-subunit alcohol dehydrogenase family)|uniref:SDR family NAD(P)-dependent oxidoreductase n=1 Tax=Phenylobacterium sp. TaxID=1871053 RepID=UPI002ED8DD1C
MSFPLPNASTDLSGQVALVTGASSGLGYRFAKVLASQGAKVAIAARRLDKLEELAEEIRSSGGVALPIEMDATDAGQLIGAVAKAEAELGVVTILVNNAGIPDAQRAHKMSLELIDRVLDVNVRAPFILSCEVARRLMAADKPGRIVNIASAAAFSYTGGGAALYSVSKAAVARTAEVLAVEWARNHINVNAIAPGAFASEMMDGMLSRVGDITQRFPRQRLGDPAQLDSTLLYLVGPASDAVTGTVIRVDDGQGGR